MSLSSPASQVTFLHGLHLVDTPRALDEAHRLLKPHGKLVAAWNDRWALHAAACVLGGKPLRLLPAEAAWQAGGGLERQVGRLGSHACLSWSV